jgi:hypothetical protein
MVWGEGRLARFIAKVYIDRVRRGQDASLLRLICSLPLAADRMRAMREQLET